jgi:hypothetical protein
MLQLCRMGKHEETKEMEEIMKQGEGLSVTRPEIVSLRYRRATFQ